MINSIVVGTDGSDTATEAVRQAGDLARQIGAKVHVVSAYEPASGVKVSGAEDGPERASWVVGPDVQVDTVLEAAAGSADTLWRARVSRRTEASSSAAGVGCSRVERHPGSAGRAS